MQDGRVKKSQRLIFLRHTLNILGNQKFLKPYDLNKKKNLDLVKFDSENTNDEEYRAKCFL